MDEQSTTMFPLFPQFPAEIRRRIWLAALEPMTLTFIDELPPRKDEELPEDPPEDLSWCTPGELAYYTIPPLFSNFSRYYGYVQLSDGSFRLQFVVRSSAAYQACKESRGFLKFIFAEPMKSGGGLPIWFRFDMDTIRFHSCYLQTITRHPWFIQAQHLHIVFMYDILDYTESYSDDHLEGKHHRWIEDNLASLKSITFEMMCDPSENPDDQVPRRFADWFRVFQEWYNWSEFEKPVPYYARVIFLENGSAEREWLTPTNYLCVQKRYYQKHFQRCYPGHDWKDHITDQKTRCIIDATDEELGNPTEFFAKHRPFWD